MSSLTIELDTLQSRRPSVTTPTSSKAPSEIPVYYPGQRLTGRVIHNVTKQRQIQTATITFRGKLETDHFETRQGVGSGLVSGPSRKATETIRLFEASQELFKGPFDVPPQRFVWPFEFVIPRTCDIRREGNRSPGFLGDGLSPIPPTFEFIDRTVAHDATAKVKYKLRVEVNSGGLLKNSDQELPITIVRRADGEPADVKDTPIEFLPPPRWESSSLRRNSLSLKQRWKSVVGDDPELKTPTISFRAYVHFPKQLTLTQEAAIGFAVKHFTTTPSDPESPTLILESIKLLLSSKTALCVAKKGLTLTGDRYCEGIRQIADYAVSFQSKTLPLNEEFVEVADGIRLADFGKQGDLHVTGDFETYIIKHCHRMRVEAVVRHQESEHQFITRCEFPFKVLDAVALTLEDHGVAGEISAIPMNDENAEHHLPAYNKEDRPPAADGPSRVI